MLKYYLQYNFNKNTNNIINLKFQRELNHKLLKKVKKKCLKKIFDNISNSRFISSNNLIEYFSKNLIK